MEAQTTSMPRMATRERARASAVPKRLSPQQGGRSAPLDWSGNFHKHWCEVVAPKVLKIQDGPHAPSMHYGAEKRQPAGRKKVIVYDRPGGKSDGLNATHVSE